jgi:cytochrome c-type biogenesis protein CcmH/NrfG
MPVAPRAIPVLWRAAAILSLAALLLPVAAADQKAPEAASAAFDRASRAATDARTQNRIEDAIGLYRQAVKLRPSWTEGWWFLGELLYDQNQYPEARDCLAPADRPRSDDGPGLRAAGPLRV